jgi:hypothetical protein
MKPLNLLFRVFLFTTLFFAWSETALPQSLPDSISPLFQTNKLLNLTLTLDLRRVLKDVGDERVEHPALISYVTRESDTVETAIMVRTRGHFRRDPMNCNFPPLRLNFPGDSIDKGVFRGQNKLKLVTHCMSRGKQHEQNILKEYLAYRLYNLFTEESYRVRLVDITYADSRGKKDTVHRMGFLIEPTGHMARRNQCQRIETRNVQQEQCDRLKSTRMAVFQYMIGNTDWSVPVPHNIVLLREQPGIAPVAVPYDFDWCGLVDAPYAVPAENLGIRDVKIRVFRGFCRSEEEFEQVFQEFRAKKPEILSTIESIPGMDEHEKKKVNRYIEQFYSTLQSPLATRNEFMNNCRTEKFP